MAWKPFRKAREARELELQAADQWRVTRRLADDEVTDLGASLSVGDRHVPVHETGGFEAIVDRHRSLTHELATSHNKRNLGEAHLNQTLNGVNGIGGGRR